MASVTAANMMKFLSHGVSSSQLSPSRCTRTTTTIERYGFKIMRAGGKWISKEVASATMDSLLLRMQERFLGLKSSVEHSTSQEFELFTSESGRGAVTQ